MEKTKERVLIIDPHNDYHENFKESLELHGIEVLIAKNEDEATNLLLRKVVSKVFFEPLTRITALSDCANATVANPSYMGGVGFELYKRIKKFASEDTAFILHSVVSQTMLTEIGFPEDMPYYQKPFCLKKLSEEVFELN